MKSNKKKNWSIVGLTLVLGCLLLFYKDITAYAYTMWGFGKGGISSSIVSNGTNPIDIDPDTIIVSRSNSST